VLYWEPYEGAIVSHVTVYGFESPEMLTVPFVPSGAEVETAERPAVSVSVMFPPLPWEIVTNVPVPILDGARQQCVYAETGRPSH